MTSTGNETNTFSIAQERVRWIDPHDCTDAKDDLALLDAVFDTLVTVQAGEIAPGLASSWEVSEDARQWRFTLREGVQFHDGSQCTASAVLQSIQRMARPDKGYTLGAPGVWHQYLSGAAISADGDRMLYIALARPIADLADILAQGFIAAPSMIAAMERGETPLPCGSGPYLATGFEAGHARMERVEAHFRGKTGPSRLRWIAETDAARRLAMLRGGEVQLANGIAPPVVKEPGLTFCRHTNPVAIIYLLNAADGPLADVRVRRALNLAIDRQRVVANVMQGDAVPLHGIMPGSSIGAAQLGVVEQDLEAARTLLASAGYRDGLKLRLDCPTRLPDEAEALTQELSRQLAPLGVSFEVTRHTDREAYAHMVRRKEIGDLCVFDSSPQSTFRVLYEKIDSRVRGSWWQGYTNASVEDDLDLACRSVAATARTTIYAQALGKLQDDPPWLTLYTPTKTVGLAGDHPDFRMPADAVLDVCTLPTV